MDEVRRYRFLVPPAVFLLNTLLICPDVLHQAVGAAIGIFPTDLKGSLTQAIFSATAISTFAIAAGFLNSSVVLAVLHVWRLTGNDFRFQANFASLELINSGFRLNLSKTDDAAIVGSIFQHSVPEHLHGWIARRWEMWMLSANSIGATAWSLLACLVYSSPRYWNGTGIGIVLICTIALTICACASWKEIGQMTDSLAKQNAIELRGFTSKSRIILPN